MFKRIRIAPLAIAPRTPPMIANDIEQPPLSDRRELMQNLLSQKISARSHPHFSEEGVLKLLPSDVAPKPGGRARKRTRIVGACAKGQRRRDPSPHIRGERTTCIQTPSVVDGN